MKFSERILHSLSRAPETKDYFTNKTEWTLDSSLSLLENEYPNFGALVSGKRVVDFGCGIGYQSIALALKHSCSVVGIDSNKKILLEAIERAGSYNIAKSRVCFVDKISDSMLCKFDIVISQNSFEHFDNPLKIIGEMKSLIKDSGKLLLTFGPPWLSPYGSHMHFFCKVPWINVFFSENTVMNVRARFRSDGATKYEDVESGLNKMTIAKFEKIIAASNLMIEFKRYRCVKGINLLSKLPFLREFFVNRISVILSNFN